MVKTGLSISEAAKRRKLKVMLALEVVVAVIIDLAMVALFYPLMEIAPERQFFLDDHSIGYTHVPNEKVPTWLLVLMALIMLFIGPITEWIMSGFSKAVLVVCAYILASCPMLFICQFLKVVVARLRPDFISRCDPDPITLICRNSNAKTVTDGRTSFPSGHCVCIFYASTCLAIYLCMVLAPFKNWGNKRGTGQEDLTFLRVLLVLAPFVVAMYVAAERSTDHRHHPGDIFAGSVLGMSGGILSLFLAHDLFRKFYGRAFGRYSVVADVKGPGKGDVETMAETPDVSVRGQSESSSGKEQN